MAHNQPGRCLHCGADDDGGDDWIVLDSVTVAPGYRTARQTAVVATEAKAVTICPACLAGPRGGLVRDLLTLPMTAAHAASGCEVHCVRGGPARVRVFTRDLARCPVCYGNARAVRGDLAPQAPLTVRAVRALAHGAGQLALAFAGDLGQVYREMTTFPERSSNDGHPSGPLPILVPDPRPPRLGQRASSPVAAGPVRAGHAQDGDRPAAPDAPRLADRLHLPRSLQPHARRPGPAGRAHALPGRHRPDPEPSSHGGQDPANPGPVRATRKNARLTSKPEGKR